MPQDKIAVEYLKGGRVKITTDEVSGPNHMAAENVIRYLAELMGGAVTKQSRGKQHVHTHEHSHEHTHEHGHE